MMNVHIAEKYIISSLLHGMRTRLSDYLAKGITQEHFTDTYCKRIWAMLNESYKGDKMHDAHALDEIVIASGVPDAREFSCGIIEIRKKFAGDSYCEQHLETLRKQFCVRQAHTHASEIQKACEEEDYTRLHRLMAKESQLHSASSHVTSLQNPLPFIREALTESVLSSDKFLTMDIPERPILLDPFFKQGDYGIIFAPRGVGKSWLSLLMGKSLSESTMMGTHWQGKESQRVLYLDSEMNLHDLQERCRMLSVKSENFSILSHEMLFSASDDNLSLNLTEPSQQQAILEYCEERKTNVLILDNLSTAFRGLRENESDSWEQVSPWILDLRRRGIAVILVCHAGRNGQIRGTSKREDPAHWILSLEDMDSVDEDGCHQFKTKFTKCRNCAPSYAPSLAWKLIHTEDGIIAETRAIDIYDQFLELVAGGITSASEIATELGKGKGTISKWAHKAQADGKIIIKNGRYLPSN